MSTLLEVAIYLLGAVFAIGALVFFVALLAEIDLEDGRAPSEDWASLNERRSSGEPARGPAAYDAAQAEMRQRLALHQRRIP